MPSKNLAALLSVTCAACAFFIDIFNFAFDIGNYTRQSYSRFLVHDVVASVEIFISSRRANRH